MRGQHFSITFEMPPGHRLDAEVPAHTLTGSLALGATKLGVIKESGDSRRQRRRIPWGHDRPFLSLLHRRAYRPDVSRHAGETESHRLQ